MAKILTGKEVAEALNARKAADVERLKLRGIIPTLCIFRVGNRTDDISYERGAMKRAEKVGVAVKQVILPEDVSEDLFEEELKKVNEDPRIHGILLFRPLPAHLDGEKARRMLNPAKDIDGSTDISQAGVFTGSGSGFSPCTMRWRSVRFAFRPLTFRTTPPTLSGMKSQAAENARWPPSSAM